VKAIKEAEYPRDDSLDNAVVVWFSTAFAPSHSANSSASKIAALRALGTLCSELESNGLTVKRCDTMEEAGARTRELQSSGHLKCVVVGGGEGVVGCASDCEDSHNSNCLVCGEAWGSHSGHQCSDGRRGSWPEDNQENDAPLEDNIVFVKSLLSSIGQVPLPSERACFFGGHGTLSETFRFAFWKLGVYIADDEAKLTQYVDTLPDWQMAQEE